VLRACGEAGIAFVPFFAIAGGPASGPAPDPADSADTEAVRKVAQAHGASTQRIRLAWTLAQGTHVLAIPGTGDPAHLRANIAAGALRLSADDLQQLEAGS
jgi:pyridoxine 4-dehydrogenase